MTQNTQKSSALVNASAVTYELHSLGWKAFQQLCISIVAEVWGQSVQSFSDSNDGGRDGAFNGTWASGPDEMYRGSFTVQCKFTSKPNKTLGSGDLSDEIEKAKRLATRGLADNYFLFTNAQLTGNTDEKLQHDFKSKTGIQHFVIFGVERISQLIRDKPRLRMLVPRVYGLGDLSQILDERACAQSDEILNALGDDLGKFVITNAYKSSAAALMKHGFVILLGEPACGKSTIAAALALGALDLWGCSTIKVRDANEFVQHSNPHEPKQFFWVDDAFGSTQIDWQTTIGWNQAFPHVQAAIRRGAKVVFTSRDYIYRSAQSILKRSALPVINDSQVVIQVQNLSKEEKEQILYNHIRRGTQPTAFKTSIKSLLPIVSDHSGFGPEIARRLGNPTFTRQLSVSHAGLLDFVSRPMEMLKEVIQTLDLSSRSAIALVFMRGGALSSPVSTTPEENNAIQLLGSTVADVRIALSALQDSLLLQVQKGSEVTWRFKHPTVRDAFAALIADNRELLDIYLTGTPVIQILNEVSCGDMKIKGVKVIVPLDRYESLWTRIEMYLLQVRSDRDAVMRFFANRCEKTFLEGYISRNPNFISSLRVGSYLGVISDVDVIVTLRKFDLLPEAVRLQHVAEIRNLAIETPDSDFLREQIRPLFEATEFTAILEAVRVRLLPCLSDTIDIWEQNHDGEEDPESHFYLLKIALSDFRNEFDHDPDAIALIDDGLSMIRKSIDALQVVMPALPDEDRDDFSGGSEVSSTVESRSVFDDVDH